MIDWIEDQPALAIATLGLGLLLAYKITTWIWPRELYSQCPAGYVHKAEIKEQKASDGGVTLRMVISCKERE